MKAEVQDAALAIQAEPKLFRGELTLCSAAKLIRAFLVKLKDRATGWKVWRRFALSVAIEALDVLLAETCE